MMKIVLAFSVVLFVGCKGSSTENVAAPSASPSTITSSPSSVASVAATASSLTPPTVTPSPEAAPAVTTVVSVPPPRAKCVCPNVRVGGHYPERSGHAAPLRADEVQTVISIDMTACVVKVRDISGGVQLESCSSPLFAPAHVNPAG